MPYVKRETSWNLALNGLTLVLNQDINFKIYAIESVLYDLVIQKTKLNVIILSYSEEASKLIERFV